MEIVPGLRYWPGFLDEPGQARLRDAILAVLAKAPLYQPTMPKTGAPLSVRMSNCGPLGWISDVTGYRYQAIHPDTAKPWPAIPQILLDAWTVLTGYPHPPEACLINLYAAGTRMGLHQDRDEADFAAPVLSFSLGDNALFRIGGDTRRAPTRSFWLHSGDVMALGGPARLAFHGVDRIVPGSSSLLADGGRLNLTLRRVTVPTTD